jgi:hypothetical protein
MTVREDKYEAIVIGEKIIYAQSNNKNEIILEAKLNPTIFLITSSP